MYDPNDPNDVRHPLHPANTGELKGGGGGGTFVIPVGQIIMWGLIVVAALVVIVLVIWFLWAALAFFIDWWFVLCGIPIIYFSALKYRGNGSPVVMIGMAVPVVICIVMVLAGISGQSQIWSGTGFTRGPDLWIAPWDTSEQPASDTEPVTANTRTTNHGPQLPTAPFAAKVFDDAYQVKKPESQSAILYAG